MYVRMRLNQSCMCCGAVGQHRMFRLGIYIDFKNQVLRRLIFYSWLQV